MSAGVVNVVAMLTGNATGMVSSFGAGSEAAKVFKDQYEKTTVAVGQGSKAMAEAAAQQATAAQAAADKSVAALEKTMQATKLTAAQYEVAKDKEAVAAKKASDAKIAADEAAARAAQTGAAADQAAADQMIAAAERAANAAKLASEQMAAASKRAGDAAMAEATAVQESVRLQEEADAKQVAAKEAAAKKINSADIAATSGATKVAAGSLAAAAVVAGASVEMAAKFEKSTELLVTAGGEAQGNLQTVRDGILNVAQATGIGIEQLSEGMYTVEKATFRGADGLKVLKAAAEGAAAENVDMGTMTNALTSIMMSYHMGADQATSATNQLVAGAGAAKTTMQEYAGSLSTVLPVASAAGVGFDQVGGAIATLTQHGTSAAESTQELANTIRGLQAPNNVAISTMQQLGINSQDVSQNLGKRGLTGTIELITDAIAQHLGPEGQVLVDTMKKSATATADLQTMMGKMPAGLREAAQGFIDGNISAKDFQKSFKDMGAEGDAQGKQFMALAQTVSGYNDKIKQGGPAAQQATAALKDIMGGATGMNTALMLGGENMGTFKAKTEEVADAAKRSGDDISTNAQTQATLAAQTERTKAMFEALAVNLGDALIPRVKDLLQWMTDTVHWFQENKGAAEALALGIGALVGGFVAWVAISKTWQATQAMSTLATKMLTAEFWNLSTAMDANPIGVVVMSLAALAAGAVWAYNNIGWFKDAVDTGFAVISNVVGTAVDAVQFFFGVLTGSAHDTKLPPDVQNWIKDVANVFIAAGKIISDIWDAITGAWRLGVQEIELAVHFVQTVIGDFVSGFQTAWKQTGDALDGAWKGFQTFAHNTVGMFTDFRNNTVGMVTDWWKNTTGMFGDFFKKVGDGWRGFWQDPIGETETFASTTVDKLRKWKDEANTAINQFATDSLQNFKTWDDSTSKVLDKWAGDELQGFKNWDKNSNDELSKWADDALKKFKKWDDDANTTMTGNWDTLLKGFKGWDKDMSDEAEKNLGKQKEALKKWDQQMSDTAEKSWADTLNGFKGWDKDMNTAGESFMSGWAKNWEGFWQDPIGESQTWDTSVNDSINKFLADSTDSFGKWDDEQAKTAQKNWDMWTSGIGKWHDDTQKQFEKWQKDTGDGFKGWDEDTSKTLEKWHDDTQKQFEGWWKDTTDGFKKWDEDTSKSADKWFADSVNGFFNWGNSTKKTTKDTTDASKGHLESFNTSGTDSVDEFNKQTNGMFMDWGKQTKGMFDDFQKNTTGMFGQWHDNMKGKTRDFVDSTGAMFSDFNKNTNGMFRDFAKKNEDNWDAMCKSLGEGAKWIGDNVFAPIGGFLNGAGKAFESTAGWIGRSWGAIQQAAADPVRFIVDTVYNQGIKTVWNTISDAVGLNMHLPDVVMGGNGGGASNQAGAGTAGGMQHFANGGVAGIMPGWSPGRDTTTIAVGGGEAIMRPEWTQAIGAERIHAMNAAARSGNTAGIRQMMGFADGGIVGAIGDITKNIAGFLSDPLGGITNMIGNPVKAMLAGIGGGQFGQMVSQFPLKTVDALGKKAVAAAAGLLSAATGGGGGGGTPVDPGQAGAGVQQWAGLVSQALSMLGQPGDLLGTTLRRMNQESGGNPNAINNWDSNAAAGIPSKGLMQVIDPTFSANAMPGYDTNIYDPLSNILASMRYAIGRYGSLAAAYDQPGGYASGGIVPTMYDQGGWLKPGLSLVNNQTGAPEPVLTQPQWSNVTNAARGGSAGGFGDLTVVVEIPGVAEHFEGKIKSVARSESTKTIAKLNRATRNSSAALAGGY